MGRPLLCTIVARNYAATARVLARSFRQQHPGARVVVLAVDDPDRRWDDAHEPFELRHPDDLTDLSTAELWRMAAAYDVTELSTAVKPWLLRTLLAEHGGPVLFLDPDIIVYAPLDDLLARAEGDRRVLTPHLLEPLPRDGRSPDETAILAAGTFNLGFLAIGPGPTSDALLDWWCERLARESVSDPAAMRFTDQRWMDLAVTHFPAEVARDPGCNVAWWNLHERPLARGGDGRWLVAGHPLRFLHLSGFDPRRPDVLSRHQGPNPRVSPTQDPLLGQLCADAAGALLAAGHVHESCRPYGWGRAGEVALDAVMRRCYREALVRAEAEAGPAGRSSLPGEPPNPFAPGGAATFRDWLAEPQSVGASRYLVGLHGQRPDLQAAFGPLTADSAARLMAWAAVDEPLVSTSDPAVLPPAGVRRGPVPVPGVNLVGYLDAEMGVGHAARLLHDALRAVGAPVAPRVLGGHRSRRRAAHAPADVGDSPYDVTLVCVNADVLPTLDLADVDPGWGPRIGLWFWETSHLPERFHGALDHVDEVWVASRFTAAAVASAVAEAGRDVPVRVVPLPVPQPTWVPAVGRHDLGLPGGRLHLLCFDLLSVVERKNPLGLVSAYREAFGPDDGAALVLKTINGHLRPNELRVLRRVVADRPDVHVVDGYLPPHRQVALTAAADVYVSLHRAEGFGLTLAEAMAVGVPVVATGWSGSLELADERTAHLVPADEVPVPDGVAAYAGGGTWAEPDLGAAARLLRDLAEHPERAEGRAEQARAELARTRTPAACGPALVEALDRARDRWAARRRPSARSGRGDGAGGPARSMTVGVG